LLVAQARLVERACEQFLARAGLPLQKNRGIGGCCATEQFQCQLEALTAPENVGKVNVADAFAKRAIFGLKALLEFADLEQCWGR
jgi:hypothetical protein